MFLFIFKMMIKFWTVLCLILFYSTLFGQQLFINEIQNRNFSTIQDEDQDFEDWVEIYNSGSGELNLLGYGLSDDQSEPFKWIFPEFILDPDSYLIVFLSGKNRTDATSQLHSNFSLSQSEALLIVDPEILFVSIIPPVILSKDASYGKTLGGGDLFYFAEPSPGAPNLSETFLGICDPPTFSHNSGFYTESFELSIIGSSGTDQIYTLDGSKPHHQLLNNPAIYEYKNHYPFNVGQSPGEFLHDTLFTFHYQNPIIVQDRSETPDRISQKSSTQFDPIYIPELPSFKGTVVRARSVAPNMLPSEIITKVFFISPLGWNKYNLPIVSLVLGENHLWDYNRGFHTAGISFDLWRSNNPNIFPPRQRSANYFQQGISTEKVGWFEFFDGDLDSVSVSGEVGLRMQGQSSRRFPRKSFRIYARSVYNNDNIEYPFFENHHTNEFERLILKNGGGDEPFANMRDVLITRLAKPMKPIVSASLPLYVFINAEFYGLNCLREDLDDNYFEIRYGILDNNLDIIKGSFVEYGTDERYLEVTDLCLEGNFNFNQFENYVDIESFMDVFIVNLIAANGDMFPKNTFWWRNKSHDTNDDRFYSALIDQDKSFAHPLNNELTNPDFDMVTFFLATQNDSIIPYLQCFRRAMDTESFSQAFVNRSADVLNTYFTGTRVESNIETLKNLYQPHYDEHIDRWSSTGRVESVVEWLEMLDEMTTFGQARPDFHRQHMAEYFETEGIYKAVLDVSDESYGYIHINTIDILAETEGINEPVYPWEGIYFNNVPVKLTALPYDGFLFSHWEGDTTSIDPVLTSAFESDSVYLKAVFVPDTSLFSSSESNQNFKAKVFPNPSTGYYSIISDSGVVYGYNLYDLTGRKLLSETNVNRTKFDLQINHAPGVYFLELLQNRERIWLKLVKQ